MDSDIIKACCLRNLDFLISKQNEEGAWLDFHLDPGVSDCWVTSYVGLCIHAAVQNLNITQDKFKIALAKAAVFVRDNEASDFGWRYNSQSPCDADSTAHAIRFLVACRIPVDQRSYSRLLGFQQKDGGFATFSVLDSDQGWTVSHPDVTPAALLALLTYLSPTHPAVIHAFSYVNQCLQDNCLVPAYWWTSLVYSSLLIFECYRATSQTIFKDYVQTELYNRSIPHGCFDSAITAELLCFFDANDGLRNELLTKLLKEQCDNGSYPTNPILRVTQRIHDQPWNQIESTGELVGDQNSLFTSATVLRALAGCCQLK